jgi:uncharacterized protein involved in response to NO
MTTGADRFRPWEGPAWLSFGFRPFFLGASIWSAFAMAVWSSVLLGGPGLPTRFDPVSWHAHELLFGYLGAVVAGFLLTAVPNWTGRKPIVGWPLGGIFALWGFGRVAVAISAGLPPLAVALTDLSMPILLAALIGREIVAGRNWRNLIMLGVLGVMILGNALFHWETVRGGIAASGYGLRLGLAAAVLMIAVIGGRIVPSFTRNWLAQRGGGRMPVSPMQRFDLAALLVLLAALTYWVLLPEAVLTGSGLFAVGFLHLARLSRWVGHRAGAEPLVWVLHAGYAMVPLGALALGMEIFVPGLLGSAAPHLWLAGGVGLMTLAVMTRATLGHTGQALTAGPGTLTLYVTLILSVLARMAAGFWPAIAGALHLIAAAAWIAAFGGFVALYGPVLLRARTGRPSTT